MKKKDLALMSLMIYMIVTFAMFIISLAAAYNPDISPPLKYGDMTLAQAVYFSAWMIMMAWAYFEGNHDGKKILRGEKINHITSGAARLSTLLGLIILTRWVPLMGFWSTVIGGLLILSAFSFVFNIKLLITRRRSWNYFPMTPGTYDSIFTLFPFNIRGEVKVFIELIGMIASIAYLWTL